MPQAAIERRIRLAGLLVSIGLAIQLATLAWNHPLSFMAFLLIGSPLMLGGVVLYLYSLVHPGVIDDKSHQLPH